MLFSPFFKIYNLFIYCLGNGEMVSKFGEQTTVSEFKFPYFLPCTKLSKTLTLQEED